MDKINSYIDFNVIINVPYKGKTNSFLGLINKKLYEYEHLLSKFGKIPNFFIVFDTKLKLMIREFKLELILVMVVLVKNVKLYLE